MIPPEFRAEAVKWVLEQGLSLAEAAERLSIPKGTLTTWVSKAKGGKAPAAPGARSVAEARREREILKKAAAYFAKESLQGRRS